MNKLRVSQDVNLACFVLMTGWALYDLYTQQWVFFAVCLLLAAGNLWAFRLGKG